MTKIASADALELHDSINILSSGTERHQIIKRHNIGFTYKLNIIIMFPTNIRASVAMNTLHKAADLVQHGWHTCHNALGSIDQYMWNN